MKVGDHVRYHSYAWGWRFGRIIGRHCDHIGSNPTGLEMATVRFAPCQVRRDIEDHPIPISRLELCEGKYPESIRSIVGAAALFA